MRSVVVRVIAGISVGLVAALTVAPARAQSTAQFEKLNQQAVDLYGQGRYAEGAESE